MDKLKGNRDTEDESSIDKTQVLEEARQCFMATSIKTKKLIGTLSRCIFILLQGEKLTQIEATNLFFLITRLFQYKDKDGTLRKLIYIGIKALSKQVENIYVVISSLTTDVNSSMVDPSVRASALRALCQISHATTFTTIEQSVVDKHPVVASAAISCLIRVASVNSEVVKRCNNVIQEALNSDFPMVQYHALVLSYNSCKDDKLLTSGLISDCINRCLRSPLTECLLIRIITNYVSENDSDDNRTFLKYVTNHLNHRSDMVEYEAANAIVNLFKSRENDEIRSAAAHLRNFISSSKPALRFAAIQSLNRMSSCDVRSWSIHRIGGVCKLHLLNRRYRIGDQIVGILDFNTSYARICKYTVILRCEETSKCELQQEFSAGFKRTHFMMTIPAQHIGPCVLTLLFHLADSYPKTLYQDKAGTIELGPNELDTKLFSCDFPIAIHS